MKTKNENLVCVCSRSFSSNETLCQELLREHQNVRFNKEGLKLDGKTLQSFLVDCDAAIVGLERIDANLLSALPNLKVVSKYGVGLDNIDLDALKSHGVTLGWTPGTNKRSVSELVVGQVLRSLRLTQESESCIKKKIWTQTSGSLLSGKCFGIVGLGNIGKDLAMLLKAFGCEIIAFDREPDYEFANEHGIRFYPRLGELVNAADVVSVHLPLDKTTFEIFDAKIFTLFKRDALFVNMSRGQIVEQASLFKMLEKNQSFKAVLDVFYDEPPWDTDLINMPNVLSTPHIGGSSVEGGLAMGRAAIKNLSTLIK